MLAWAKHLPSSFCFCFLPPMGCIYALKPFSTAFGKQTSWKEAKFTTFRGKENKFRLQRKSFHFDLEQNLPTLRRQKRKQTNKKNQIKPNTGFKKSWPVRPSRLAQPFDMYFMCVCVCMLVSYDKYQLQEHTLPISLCSLYWFNCTQSCGSKGEHN